MAARYWVGGTGTWDAISLLNWSTSSGGAAGASVPGSGDTVIFDGASGGGVITLGANISVVSITMGAFTGTFDSSTFTVTLQTFSCSGTGTRTLNMGSGQWTVTGNAATVWDITTFTNLTFIKGSLPVIFSYSGSTGTRTVVNGAITPLQLSSAIDVSITAGTDTVAISNSRIGHLVFTGFSGTLSNGTRVVYGNLTLTGGMTIGSGSAVTTLAGTSGTQTITSNGNTMDFPLTIDGVGGTVSLADSVTVGATRTVTLTNGTFDTNGQACSWGLFASANTNTRVLTITNSTIDITATTSSTVWNVNNGSGSDATALTLNATGSLIRMSGAAGANTVTFAGGGRTYNNVEFNGPRRASMTYQSTFANLTYIGTDNTDCRFTVAVNQTVTGTWTVTGANATRRPLIVGAGTSFEGTRRTVTVGAVAFTNADFMSIGISGVTATGTRLGDALNNSGITFDTPRTLYWVSGTGGNWSDTAKWSLSSGGASGEPVPLPQDNVIFDANSITSSSQTVTADVIPLGLDVSFANVGVAPALALRSSGVLGNSLFGSIALKAGMTVSGSDEFYLRSTTSKTITSAGVAFSQNFVVVAPGGTYTLQDNLATGVTRTFQLLFGTFNANGYNVTAGFINSSGANVRTLTMSSGIWTATGAGTVFNFGTTTNLTFDAGTSQAVITDTSASVKTVNFANATTAFNVLTIPASGSGIIAFTNTSGYREINMLRVYGTNTLRFSAGQTYKINSFDIPGSYGVVTMISATPTSQYTLSNAGGLVQLSNINITDAIGAGGAYWQAINSTNGGNNTNINFVTASAGGGLQAGKKFAAFGGARPINKVLDSQLHGYRKLGG